MLTAFQSRSTGEGPLRRTECSASRSGCCGHTTCLDWACIRISVVVHEIIELAKPSERIRPEFIIEEWDDTRSIEGFLNSTLSVCWEFMSPVTSRSV
jgi:hypothetical protein